MATKRAGRPVGMWLVNDGSFAVRSTVVHFGIGVGPKDRGAVRPATTLCGRGGDITSNPQDVTCSTCRGGR